MLDKPRRGKRGPAPSWKLGSTRAIRVPIILADALLSLARRVDNGEVTLVDAVLTESDKQVSRQSVVPSDEEQHYVGAEHREGQASYKQITRHHPHEANTSLPLLKATSKETIKAKRALAARRHAEAQASFAEAQASFAEAQASFAEARNIFIHNIKREIKREGSSA